MEKKFVTSREFYNTKVINDIIYNEPTNIVSVFKDYLIFDDVSEFLKRYYRSEEALARLPKMYDFYETYAQLYPSYIVIENENKYMFKNIERKQRREEEKQNFLKEQQDRANGIVPIKRPRRMDDSEYSEPEPNS